MEMKIRNFEVSDREAVLGMVDAFYNSPGVLQPIPVKNFTDAFDEMCSGGSHRLRGMLIEVDGENAGFCTLTFSYSTEAGGSVVHLEEVYICPEYREQGLGSGVLDYIKEEYEGKAARIRLEVSPQNPRAIALYERFGFEKLPYVQMILERF